MAGSMVPPLLWGQLKDAAEMLFLPEFIFGFFSQLSMLQPSSCKSQPSLATSQKQTSLGIFIRRRT